MKLFEAATIRNRARAAAKALRDLLAEKVLPQALRVKVSDLHDAMGKTWGDLEADAAGDPAPTSEGRRTRGEGQAQAQGQPLREGANVGEWLESRLHLMLTQIADDLFGQGRLTREERITLSKAIGEALDAYHAAIADAAPQLYQRSPDEPSPAVPEGEASMGEAATKREDGKDFLAGDFAYVPDPEKPSEWKLRLTSTPGGEPDAAIVGAAAAALGAGYRGQKVDLPQGDLAAARAKVRAAWRKANPDKDDAEMPEGIREAEVEVGGEFVALVERSVRRDGTIPVKIIKPGWGSSGYYQSRVLERDGPTAFPKGTKMYWNHPTAAEEASRPEGDLNNLAAELTSDARYITDHPNGPGLYADAKVFRGFQPAVDELGPHIGVSIRARGKAEAGIAEGRSGAIITAIVDARSVDFVTEPGAGGKVLQLFEARRGAAHISNIQQPTKGVNMDEKEIQKLQESNAQLQRQLDEQKANMARLSEALLLREASEFAAMRLAKAELPAMTRNRLLKQLAVTPPLKEGKLDCEAFDKVIDEAVKAEVTYLTEVSGVGQIVGMGANHSSEVKPEQFEGELAQAFGGLGLKESTAKLAAKGR